MPEMGAEVRAVRIEDVEFSSFVAVGDEVLTEVAQSSDLTGRELD
jgi:hypothetical protein